MASAVFANAQCGDAYTYAGFTRTAILSSLAGFHSVGDDLQKLLFEPGAYKADFAKELKCTASQLPANWDERFRTELAQLKTIVDRDSKSLAWKPRLHQRPVEQKMVTAKFNAFYPGVTIVKIGSDFKDWNTYKNSLGIPTNRFIRGEAVLKFANRPGCQAHAWIVKQTYKGGGWSASMVEAFGGGGYFVMCP